MQITIFIYTYEHGERESTIVAIVKMAWFTFHAYSLLRGALDEDLPGLLSSGIKKTYLRVRCFFINLNDETGKMKY